MLGFTTEPPTGTASYFSMGDPTDLGNVTVVTACSFPDRSGVTGLTFQTPNSATNGLYLYERIWVKHDASSWNSATLVINHAYFAKTVRWHDDYFSGGYLINQPVVLGNASFSGAHMNDYDVGVSYSIATPGGAWSTLPFFVEDEYWETLDTYGNGGPQSNCEL